LQAQGNVENHEDAGWTLDDIKDWTELPDGMESKGVASFGLRPSGMRKNQSSHRDDTGQNK